MTGVVADLQSVRDTTGATGNELIERIVDVKRSGALIISATRRTVAMFCWH